MANVLGIGGMVDDVRAMLKGPEGSGAKVMKEREESEFGLFGWFVDPEGNTVELWEMPGRKRSPRRKR
jgi:predicted enzyme related to lactoylglutathione lyase